MKRSIICWFVGSFLNPRCMRFSHRIFEPFFLLGDRSLQSIFNHFYLISSAVKLMLWKSLGEELMALGYVLVN